MKHKSLILTGLILCIALMVYTAKPANAADEANDPEAIRIVGKVLDDLAPGQWKGKYRFTNFRVDGTKKTYTLEVLAFDRNTVHVSFLTPPADAGRQILNKDGEIWSYLPDSKKIVRLADRDSIGNGDFNNADVMKLDWISDYNMKIVQESKTQWVIDMKAKPDNGATYFLIRLWVLKKGIQAVQQYFYDSSGHHMKTLKYRNVKEFPHASRPAHLIMENVLTGQRTFLEILTFEKKSNLPESRFRPENLGK